MWGGLYISHGYLSVSKCSEPQWKPNSDISFRAVIHYHISTSTRVASMCSWCNIQVFVRRNQFAFQSSFVAFIFPKQHWNGLYHDSTSYGLKSNANFSFSKLVYDSVQMKDICAFTNVCSHLGEAHIPQLMKVSQCLQRSA